MSLLLHVLFFLLWENLNALKLFTTAVPVSVQSEPIVLDLQPAPENKPKRVIESPPDTETPKPPPRADFYSDKNARARNSETDPSKPITDEPYNPGELDTHDLPPSPKPAPDNPTPVEPEQKPLKNLLDTERIVREQFQKKIEEESSVSSERERTGIAHRQFSSRVKDMGGLSFNTYNWDFAPYMLRLKALIEQNIHPPYAFTQLGLISGITLLRFKIFPDGTLKDLEVLNYQGHRDLMETSVDAVQISAPFPDLPKNFPEPYLEVTGKFLYLIRKNK